MTDYGIDLSHWNRVTDFNAVRGNGISYASVKLTEGVDFIDNASVSHTNGAKGAGLRVGGYHFARDLTINGQVDHFAGQLRARGLLGSGALAPMLDMEHADLRDNANPFVAAFIARLRAVTGVRKVLVYANLDWWTRVLRPDEWADADVHLWIARYNGLPGKPDWSHPRLALHQHTDSGVVPGIPGKVDRNATVGGFTLDHLTLDGTPAPAPPPLPNPAPQPQTYTVRAGDTLSGIAQRHGTTWRELARINGISNPDRIFPGQVLTLTGPSAGRFHTVRTGDTLSGIAQQYGTTWRDLARINAIHDPDRIFPGQVIRLP
ncbi:LysM peptidoglycan-binding domain-containing protein [Actinokineospora cianjurensis]|uniref:LysM domain-containing protein n=1 Tax=Actinokineospora cianjurensis TaxID=585224 RepID=A0A421AYE9_9PSEU|nr:LysM peptidoglycan-binding domain-containing protein [Actinokineospora cianjurensis]RLK54815.1 LysM domain-containing protein [Actinokineospora cianjurensis]